MSDKKWITKEDILKDLATVTGTRVTHIDDRFAVRGERPPPVYVPDEDEDEFVQAYGQYASKDSNMAKPDLSGITHMLRMVNEYYDSATYDDNANINELKKAANTVINISKLDPNVPEFIPKKLENAVGDTNNVIENSDFSKKPKTLDCLGNTKSNSQNLDIRDLVCTDNDAINKTDASHMNKTNNNDIDVTKKIDVASLNSKDIKDIREKLKLKIIDTSKAECLKKKREKNLAMASLLKLHTEIPKSPTNNPPLKLMTPEYFQILPEDIPSSSICTETKQNVIKEEIKKEIVEKNEIRNTNPTNQLLSSPRTTSQESSDTFSNNTSGGNSEKESNRVFMSKEVEESVKKVDKWLNGPEKKKHKSRAAYFGPVTFKRKGSNSINSNETNSVAIIDNIEITSSTNTSESFVPSAYANELTKTYMERSQSTAVRNEDIWAKLERQLQEKDKAIKETLLSTQAQK